MPSMKALPSLQHQQMLHTVSRHGRVGEPDLTVTEEERVREWESESCESAATATQLLWYLAPCWHSASSGRRIFPTSRSAVWRRPESHWASAGGSEGVRRSRRGGHKTFQRRGVSQTPQTIKTRRPRRSLPSLDDLCKHPPLAHGGAAVVESALVQYGGVNYGPGTISGPVSFLEITQLVWKRKKS